jgi:hypothetical protein
MKILIGFIPHEDQRYETCGDYYYDKEGNLIVLISDTGDQRSNFAVAIHEVFEALSCQIAQIPEEDITEFDIAYEEARKPEDTTSEPGDDPAAPYRLQHQSATLAERIFCDSVDLDWSRHEANVYAL